MTPAQLLTMGLAVLAAGMFSGFVLNLLAGLVLAALGVVRQWWNPGGIQ